MSMMPKGRYGFSNDIMLSLIGADHDVARSIRWSDIVIMAFFRCAAFVLAVLCAGSATAHSWYDSRCCSGRDCHPVPCEQLSQAADGGLTYRPTGIHFYRENVLPSQDAQCHICTSRPASDAGYGYCAYIQQGS